MPHVEPEWRAYRKVLRMVSELHVRGFQRLRIAPGQSPSGMYWRCSITPVSNIMRDHGALMTLWRDEDAHYSSAQDRNFFGWADARHATPSKLADLFVIRFPDLARSGKGSDWPYAGWYIELLHLTYPDRVPVAYGDYLDASRSIPATGPSGDISIPLPPPGEGEREESLG